MRIRSTTSSYGKPGLRRTVAIGAAVAALAAPAAAFAQDASDSQYGNTLEQISAGQAGGGPSGATAAAAPTSTDTGGSLPFTGLDLVAMAAVAAGLGIGGFAMRRHLSTSGHDATS